MPSSTSANHDNAASNHDHIRSAHDDDLRSATTHDDHGRGLDDNSGSWLHNVVNIDLDIHHDQQHNHIFNDDIHQHKFDDEHDNNAGSYHDAGSDNHDLQSSTTTDDNAGSDDNHLQPLQKRQPSPVLKEKQPRR